MLTIFEKFPRDSTCPICKTNKDEECMLIIIDGTDDDGIREGQPAHTGCLQLRMNKEHGLIYQQT